MNDHDRGEKPSAHSVLKDPQLMKRNSASEQDQQKLRNSMSPRRNAWSTTNKTNSCTLELSSGTLIASEANPATNFILSKAKRFI